MTEPDVFSVEGHLIRGYELLKRRVSRAHKSAGRIVVPVEWIGATVKVVFKDEIYEDYVRPGGNQGRLNIRSEYIGETAGVIRTSD